MKRLILLVVIYLAFVSLGLPDGVLGLAWPAMRVSLAQPIEALGLVTFILASCSALSGFVSGRVLARFGTGPVTPASAAMTGLSLLGLSFVPNFPLMVALAFPLGLGAGAVDAGLNHYVAEHFTSKHMNWLHACWGLGATLGPVIMGYSLATAGGWSQGYLFLALGQLTLAAILFFSLGLWSQQEPARHDPAKIVAGGRPLTPRWAQFLAAFLFALYVAVEMGTGLWAASVLIESRHFDPGVAGLALTLYYGAITGGRVLVGFVSEKLGNRRLIRVGLGLALAGVVLLMIPAWPTVALIGIALMGFGCAPIYPALMHETPRRFDPATARRVIGWQVAAANLGGALLPAAFGLQAAQLGLESIFVTVAVLILLLLVLSSRLDKVTS
ncbi:MAG: MFS transporter [Propionivibrio sp.]